MSLYYPCRTRANTLPHRERRRRGSSGGRRSTDGERRKAYRGTTWPLRDLTASDFLVQANRALEHRVGVRALATYRLEHSGGKSVELALDRVFGSQFSVL
jgi:hypothetical protein